MMIMHGVSVLLEIFCSKKFELCARGFDELVWEIDGSEVTGRGRKL